MFKIFFTKLQNYKIKNSHILYARSGQSLAEVMIGLAIGAILIGAASFAITTMLKTNLSAQRSQFAANLAQETIERVRSYASADWQNVYGLTKGSSTPYYFVASGTQFFAVQGTEGIIENDIQSGLVGHWGFDEATGTTAYDGTGNRYNGVLTNSPIRATSTCKIGNCISFGSGSTYVNVVGTSTLNFANNGIFSISIWVNPDTLMSSWRRGIIVQENYLTSGYRLGFYNGGQPMFWTTQSGGSLQLNSSQNLIVNSWNHIVVTYDNQQANIYKDGILAGSATGTYVMGLNAVRIGAAVSEYFSGKIDDVRFYNHALSADEVKQLYNSSVYSRSFYIENACRTNDASSTYSGVSPCGGGSVDDPSSQKVTAQVDWGTGFGSGRVVLSDMLTRWKNAIFQQTDWSGGVSGDVLINSGTTFASSSNVNSGGGSLRINGL